MTQNASERALLLASSCQPFGVPEATVFLALKKILEIRKSTISVKNRQVPSFPFYFGGVTRNSPPGFAFSIIHTAPSGATATSRMP